MKLFLVRHGASTGNTPGHLLGHGEHPLTARGLAQAEAVAARLEPLGPMPVHCSDLERARQTAERIAGMWESTPRVVQEDARLRELHLGAYEGKSWDDYLADEKLNAAMIADPLHTRLPGGESVAEMQGRALAAVREIVTEYGEFLAIAERFERTSVPSGAVRGAHSPAAACVVAHDGPIRAILNHFLGVIPEKWWALTTTHGGVSLLEWSNGWVNVRFVNDTSHLTDCGAVQAKEEVR